MTSTLQLFCVSHSTPGSCTLTFGFCLLRALGRKSSLVRGLEEAWLSDAVRLKLCAVPPSAEEAEPEASRVGLLRRRQARLACV